MSMSTLARCSVTSAVDSVDLHRTTSVSAQKPAFACMLRSLGIGGVAPVVGNGGNGMATAEIRSFAA